MIESYLELIGTTARGSPRSTRSCVAVQVDARRVRDRGARRRSPRRWSSETERVAQGLEAAEVTRARRAQPRPAGAGAADGVRPLRPRRAGRAGGRRPRARGPVARPAPGRWARARAGTTTAATAPCTPPTGSAAGRGSRSRRCSWTRCSGSSSAVRTVAVTFEPLAAERSTREVEAAVTRDRADRELRAPLRPVRDRAPAPGPRRHRCAARPSSPPATARCG